jgi:hypothetical protein
VGERVLGCRSEGRVSPPHPLTLSPLLLSLAILLIPGTASAQQPGAKPADQGEYQQRQFPVQLEPPGPARIFRVESENAFRERIRQQFRERNERAKFPEDIELTPSGYVARSRTFPPMASLYVPEIICYNPLYFEDLNAERYGWDAGIFQPFLSVGKFYCDLALLPYNIGVQHPWSCEFNAGYYLPGDPVPYLKYCPPCSVKGALLEAGVWAGGIALFP